MSENTTLNIPQLVVEQVHCSICEGYLSCGPVRLLPDGSSICGQCTPPSSDLPVYRELALEAILSCLAFPCRFKQDGCEEVLPFGQTTDHESSCVYRPFTCPSLPSASCCWKGCMLHMLDHYTNVHANLLLESAAFKVPINEDAQEVFVVVKNNIIFVIKYVYDAKESILKYDVRYCKPPVRQNVSCKIHLINDSDPECTVTLKTHQCYLYDESLYDLQNGVVLNLHKFLPSLGEPGCIIVDLNLKAMNCTESSVNHQLLESLKCKCQNYLIPPLYDLYGTTICCDCAKKYSNLTLTKDAEVLKHVGEADFPCCWRNCNFVSKSDKIRMHEFNCRFRCYRCCYSDCGIALKLDSAINHLKNHGALNLADGFLKTSFSYSVPFKAVGYRYAFALKNDVLVMVKYGMFASDDSNLERFRITLISDWIDITVVIHFEHPHCKIKSKPFVVNSSKIEKIVLSELPSCFKRTDELLVKIGDCHLSSLKKM